MSSAIRITGTGVVNGKAGTLRGFYVSNTTAGTLVLKDGGASGGQISGTITPAIGWHEFPADFRAPGGLHATVGGTIDVTFFVESG